MISLPELKNMNCIKLLKYLQFVNRKGVPCIEYVGPNNQSGIYQFLSKLIGRIEREENRKARFEKEDAEHDKKVEEARNDLKNLANLVVKYKKGRGKLSTCKVSYDGVIAFFKQYHYDPSPLPLPLVFPKKEDATREKILKVFNVAVPYFKDPSWSKAHQERLDSLKKELNYFLGKLRLTLTFKNECRLEHLEKGLYPRFLTSLKLKNSLLDNKLTRGEFWELMELEEEAKAKLLEEAKAKDNALKKKEEMVRIL